MDGIMDCIQTVLLCYGSQLHLALGGTVLAVHTPSQILLGGGGHVGLQLGAQQLGKLCGVLCLFICGLLPVQADLGIALTMSDTGHAQIHTHLGALAGEVGLQLLEDICLVFVGNSGVVLNGAVVYAVLMLSGQRQLALELLELVGANAAEGTFEISGQGLALVNITANSANILSHNCYLHKIVCKLVMGKTPVYLRNGFFPTFGA